MSFGSFRSVNVDLFTDAYRVTCGVEVSSSGGIHYELGNPNTDYLEVQDAYISRIHQPGEIVAYHSQGAFRKENINFIVLQDRREGIPVGSSHARSVFNKGKPAPVFLTVPSFEIQGEVMYDGKLTPSAILVQSTGNFQVVFDAKAKASHYPDISYSGDLILIHKDRIGVFCIESK